MEPTAGRFELNGTDISSLPESEVRPYRRDMQIVFQDPYSSLNPRLSAGAIVAEPLTNFDLAAGAALTDRIAELFHRVGLRPAAAAKVPHAFFRRPPPPLGLPRALAGDPEPG